MFGQPAEMDLINEFANKNNLWVLDDAAQSFGGKYRDKNVGNLSEVSATSFFPAKPLGCYGDGGALFTNDKEIYEIGYSTHIHGMGKSKYDYERIGMNARMSSIQAAILLEKLKIFPTELNKRQKVADTYNKILKTKNLDLKLPTTNKNARSSWAQYTIILPKKINRGKLQEYLKSKKIPTAVYYPTPINMHLPYNKYPVSKAGLEISNYLSKHVLSLPMHPYLNENDINYISENISDFYDKH